VLVLPWAAAAISWYYDHLADYSVVIVDDFNDLFAEVRPDLCFSPPVNRRSRAAVRNLCAFFSASQVGTMTALRDLQFSILYQGTVITTSANDPDWHQGTAIFVLRKGGADEAAANAA
jgi:hypothetical protein